LKGYLKSEYINKKRFSVKLLLILPNPYPGFKATRSLGKRSNLPPLNLPYIAALTPPDIEVKIVDENVDEIDFEEEVDMVGISVLTTAATRAYEIAREFRERGICVVLGGIHPTLLPEETSPHVDTIVIGEAENVWEQLLADFRKGKLRKTYRGKNYPQLDNLPKPRWELLKKNAYITTNVIQVSRGCPYHCNFCSIWRTFGRNPRYRPITDVIQEIETFKGKLVGFADADIIANPKYAKELFEALEPLNKLWVADAGLKIAKNNDLLKIAAKSGCKIVYIGFESILQDSLEQCGKFQNLKIQYRVSIDRLHQNGIMVGAGFIFGFDTDDKSVFERTVEFAIDCKVDMADFHVLCPYPGTGIYDQLKSEGRIFETDWSKYSKYNVVFQPKKMSPDALLEGCYWAWKQFYYPKSILHRFLSAHVFKSWINIFGHLAMNLTLNREAAHYQKILKSNDGYQIIDSQTNKHAMSSFKKN